MHAQVLANVIGLCAYIVYVRTYMCVVVDGRAIYTMVGF